MNDEEEVLCSHELVIRFDQHKGNRVTWYVIPDKELAQTWSLSLIDLAEIGAPLAAMGIWALWKLCADGLVHNSLEQANSIQAGVGRRLAAPLPSLELEAPPEGATIN